jgi:hypothetical protein
MLGNFLVADPLAVFEGRLSTLQLIVKQFGIIGNLIQSV